MNKRDLSVNLFAILCLTTLAWCSKSGEKPIEEEKLPFTQLANIANEPGFGDSDEEPVGTPFKLPKGLRFVQRPNHPFDPDIKKLHGNMNTFYVDINIVADSTWKGGEIIFPEGLVVMNVAPSRIQNGMLMGREPIPMPSYGNTGGNDTTTFYLGVACMNSGKGLPWEENNTPDTRNYPIGKGMYIPTVVTKNEQALKFLSLLNNKPHLKLKQHYNPMDAYRPDYVQPAWLEPYSVIQTMFWKLTDGNGLAETDLRELMEAIKP